MATVTCLGVSYPCATALKGDNYIHLLDENGTMIVAFDDISDFYNFEITDGEWTAPQPHGACKVAVIREDGSITAGPHKCIDIARHVNLLDNSDFRNPINQRGAAIYTASGYTIDRWRTFNGIRVMLTAAGVVIDGSSVDGVLQQNIASLHSGTYTFVAKVNGQIYYRVFSVDESSGSVTTIDNTHASFGGSGYLNAGTSSGGVCYVAIHTSGAKNNTVEWVALYEGEYNADMMPSYTPKGRVAELAECQRYFWMCDNTYFAEGFGYAFDATTFRASIVLPAELRGTPTLGSDSDKADAYGINVCTNSGVVLSPATVSVALKRNRACLTLTGAYTPGEVGVLRLERPLSFSADL